MKNKYLILILFLGGCLQGLGQSYSHSPQSWVGGYSNSNIEVRVNDNYNKNTYELGQNSFDPETGQLEPLIEHHLDPSKVLDNITLYQNQEVDYVFGKIKDALNAVKEDLKESLSTFYTRVRDNFIQIGGKLYSWINTDRVMNGSQVSNATNQRMTDIYGNYTQSERIGNRNFKTTGDSICLFSTLEISLSGDDQIFPENTTMEYAYFFPDGEVYGYTEDSSSAFIAISDIFFFSANNDSGDQILETQNPGYTIKAHLGFDDRRLGESLSPNGQIGLYFRPDDNAPWTLISTYDSLEEKTFTFTKLGRFTFGVHLLELDKDTIAPDIFISIPQNPTSNEDKLRVTWQDNVGVNPNSVFLSVGDTLIRLGLADTAIVMQLSDLPDSIGNDLTVTLSDHAGNRAEKRVDVSSINRFPEDIKLSNSTISENSELSTLVGHFESIDQDKNDVHTYILSDNTSFRVDGNSLLSNASFDYETKNVYNFKVITTDAKGLTYEKNFTIKITDDETDNTITALPPLPEDPNNPITLYPNPNSGYLKIGGLNRLGDVKIEIYNISGVLMQSYNQRQNTYDISNLPSGLYVVKIRSDGKGRTINLIKN